MARTRKATVFLTPTSTVFLVRGATRRTATVRMDLPGSAPLDGWDAGGAAPAGIVDSYVGSADRWKTSIPAYSEVKRRDVFPEIDLVFHGNSDRELEFDFRVHPGGDPSSIRLRFAGASSLAILPSGDLRIATAEGDLIQHRPVATQPGSRRKIAASFRLLGSNEVGFSVGKFDRNRELVIDPVVTFSSFYGAEGDDAVTAVSDEAVAGYTNSIEFPAAGASSIGGYDAFLTTLQRIPRTIYVGGSGDDKALAVSASLGFTGTTPNFQIAFGGETDSPDFPEFSPNTSTPGPRTSSGKDAFVFYYEFTGAGIASRCHVMGGSGDERVLAIGRASNFLHVAGETTSPDLPTGRLSFQPQLSGPSDGFFWYVQSRGSSLAYSMTYFGGNGNDRVTSLSANGYIAAGTTDSTDLPVRNAFQSANAGGKDGFLVSSTVIGMFNPSVITYLGGSGDDEILSLSESNPAAAAFGPVYFGGTTTSTDLPVARPWQGSPRGGADGFFGQIVLSTLAAQAGQAPSFLSYFGGSGNDRVTGVAGNISEIYLGGDTTSSNLQTINATQSTHGGGGRDAFVAGFSAVTYEPFWITYAGGEGDETSAGVATPISGGVVTGGVTNSNNFPGIPGNSRGRGADGFTIAYSSPQLRLTPLSLSLNPGAVSGFGLVAARLPSPIDVRVRSSDPSKFMLTVPGGAARSGSGQFRWSGDALTIPILGKADSGTADLIIEADGFPPARATVNLRPLRPILTASRQTSFSNLPSSFRDSGIIKAIPNSVSLALSFVATNDSGQFLPVFLEPGELPITYTFESSDPSVAAVSNAGRIRTASTVIDGLKPGKARVTGRVYGDGGLLAETAIDLDVQAPELAITARPLTGLSTSVYVQLDVPSTSPMVSMIKVLNAPAGTGLVSMTGGPLSSEVEAAFGVRLVTGPNVSSVRLRAEAEGFAAVERDVAVEPGYAGFRYRQQNLTVDQTTSMEVAFASESDFNSGSLFSGMASTVRQEAFRITSSDPSIVEVQSEPSVVSVGGSVGIVNLRAVRPGRATLSLESVSGFPVFEGARTYEVEVASRPAVSVQTPGLRILGDSVVGKDLQTTLSVTAISDGQTRVPEVTVTSSDPSKLVLSSSVSTPGQASITGQFGSGFWAQALADSGTVTLTVSSPQFESIRLPVRLVKSYVAFRTPLVVKTEVHSTVGFTAGLFRAVPSARLDTYDVVSNALTRPGVGQPDIRVVNRNPEIGSIAANARTFTPARSGTATLEVESGNFPVLQSGRLLTIEATAAGGPPYSLGDMALGMGMQSTIFGSTFSAAGVPVTVTSSDPSRVAVSSPEGSASDSAQVDYGRPFVLHGRADSGQATITVSSSAFEPVTFEVFLTPVTLAFAAQFQQTQTVESRDMALVLGASAQLNASIIPVNPRALQFRGSITRSTDAGPVQATLAVSDPSVLGVELISPLSYRLIPKAPGTATVRLELPAGMHPGEPELRERRVTVLLPSISVSPVTLSKNVERIFALNQSNSSYTVTSSDPSKLLLAPVLQNTQTAGGPGQASLTIPGQSPQFLIQALSDTGTASIEVLNSGFNPSSIPVRFTPLALQLMTQIQPRIFTGGSLAVLAQIVSASQVSYRSGAPPMTLRLESSNPAVAEVVEPSIVFPGQSGFTIRGRGAGNATLRLVSSDADTRGASLAITVQSPAIRPGSGQVNAAKNMVSTAGFSIEGLPPGTNIPDVTVRSTEPGRVLVSSSPQFSGAATTTTRGNFYIHGVGSSGTVELVLEAPGFEPAVMEVRLYPSGFGLTNYSSSPTIQTSSPHPLTTYIVGVDPVNGEFVSMDGRTLMPGVEAEIRFENSNPAAGTIQGEPARWVGGGTSGQPAPMFNPSVAGGTTVVRVIQPPGYVAPRAGAQITFEVPVRRTFNWQLPSYITRGTGLTTRLEFPNAAPAPGAVMRIVTRDGLNLAATCTTVSSTPAYETTSPESSFCLQGLTQGRYDLRVEINGFEPRTFSMDVRPIDVMGSVVTVAVGSRAQLNLRLIGNFGETVTNLLPSFVTIPAKALTVHPEIATASPAEFTLVNGSAVIEILGRAAGTTQYVIQTPSMGAGILMMPVTVTGPSRLQMDTTRIAPTRMATPMTVAMTGPRPASLTIALTDASQGQLFPSIPGVPAASINITPSQNTATFHVSPRGELTGTIGVRVSAPGYETVTFQIPVAAGTMTFRDSPLRAQFAARTNLFMRLVYIEPGSSQIRTATNSVLPFGGQLTFRSENTNIAAVSGLVDLNDPQSSAIIQGVQRGTTQIRFNMPPGYPAPPGIDSLTVNVE